MQAFLNTNLSTVENAVLTGWKVYDSGSGGELGEFIEDKNFGSYSDFASYLKGDGCYNALSRE